MMGDEAELDLLLESVMWQADSAALDEGRRPGATSASVIRAAVGAAFRGALHNRMITIVPEADWPFIVARPPQ